MGNAKKMDILRKVNKNFNFYSHLLENQVRFRNQQKLGEAKSRFFCFIISFS